MVLSTGKIQSKQRTNQEHIVLFFFFENRIKIANSFVVNPEQKASHPPIITQQRKKEEWSRRGFIHLFILYLINPSLFIKMGESRLKMNLLYTSSPVKGHSVQCSWCLQCVSTRDMLQFRCVSDGLNCSQHSKKFPAASSRTEVICSVMNQLRFEGTHLPR